MFQKVKKLGNKLFGDHHSASNGDERSSSSSLTQSNRSSSVRNSLGPDHLQSPKSSLDLPPKSLGKTKDPTHGAGLVVAPNVVQHTHGTTVTHNRPRGPAASSSAFLNPELSASSRSSCLPSVQVDTHVGGGAAATGHMPRQPRSPAGAPGSPAGGTNARRKSMPAAVDMALRTAEGRAHIEELMNSGGKKQMVFGQYFGSGAKAAAGPSAPSADNAAVASRFQKQVKAAAASTARPTGNDKVIGTVAEDAPASAPVAPILASAPVHKSGKHVNNVESPSLGEEAEARAKCMASDDNEMPKNKILSMAATLPNRMARKHWSLSDYSIVRKLYTGYASTVYQATCKRSLEQVALKIYHMENLCELNHYQVFREIRVHASLQHQNIITIFCTFQEGSDVVLVQEYAEGGDLYRLLYKNGGRLSERQAVEMVLAPFLHAMHYLHTRGIMHRDIKPENVLFTESRVLKLADFGLAIDLNEEKAVTRAGTLDYMPPEVLRCPPKNHPQENKNVKSLQYNNSVDAWAVGVFAYELIVGVAPFAGKSQLDCVDRIIHSSVEFPEKVSELAKSFITAALKKHPGDRPTILEMLHHPWIHTYKRRTSTLMPAVSRRRSSALGMLSGQTAQANEEATQHLDLDKLTSKQVEELVNRLQSPCQAQAHAPANASGLTTQPSLGSGTALRSARMAQHAHV